LSLYTTNQTDYGHCGKPSVFAFILGFGAGNPNWFGIACPFYQPEKNPTSVFRPVINLFEFLSD
jgi:hypothetical protein